jgi:hypothetical protein
MSHRHVLVVAALLASAPGARAADPPPPPAAPALSAVPVVAVAAVVYGYVVPEQEDFAIVDAMVDVGRLHIEGRYNYEGLRTGSIFVGANASAGDKLTITGTAMLGAVFGDIDGVAPGFRVTLTWWKLDLTTEDEIVIDAWAPNGTFFYSWSELGLSPLSWLRVGIVGQRLREVSSGLDLQRGLFAGVSYGKLGATVYELNAGWTTPTWVFALAAGL